MNDESVPHSVITIMNFPSRSELYNLIENFLNENRYNANYKTKNSDNMSKFYFRNENIALDLVKRLNIEKVNNKLYKNLLVYLTVEEVPQYNIKIKQKRVNSQSDLNSENKTFKKRLVAISSEDSIGMQKGKKMRDNSLTYSYDHMHLLDLTSKAGIMSNDSPYITAEELMRRDQKEKMKKNISRQDFKSFFDKATINKKNNFIKNYVNITPSVPIHSFKFRSEEKKKWICKKNFVI